MLQNRVTAHGEFWQGWHRSIRHTSKMQLFPTVEHGNKAYITIQDDASYVVTDAIKAALNAVGEAASGEGG